MISSVLSIVDNSTGLAIPLADVKSHLNIDYDSDDARIISLINVATEWIESETGRTLTPRTYLEVYPCFPFYNYYQAWDGVYGRQHKLELSIVPATAVNSVSYYDTTNTLQAWSSTNYYAVYPMRTNAFIQGVLCYPATFQRPDAVQVNYTAGSTPEVAKHLIRIMCSQWNENREADVVGTIVSKSNYGVDRLLAQLKTGHYY